MIAPGRMLGGLPAPEDAALGGAARDEAATGQLPDAEQRAVSELADALLRARRDKGQPVKSGNHRA